MVKDFNNIIATNVAMSARPKDSKERVALAIASDNDRARTTIMALIEEIGFDACDAGALEDSWRFQAGQPA